MKKTITLITAFLFTVSFASAQMWNGVDTLYGNEWIEYDQSYYKVQIAEDGIYRISQQDLFDQGVPINSIQGDQLQLFYMGESHPIYVSTSGILGAGDFVEFYGKRNRGDLDEFLFEDPISEMANPEYSLFSDSSAYFLTWGITTPTENFEVEANNLNNAPPTPESYCFYTYIEMFNQEFSKKKHPQSVYHANFQMAEGFVGETNQMKTITLNPEAIYSSGPNSKLTTRVAVTNFTDLNPNHIQKVSVNGTQLAEDNFANAKVLYHEFDLSTSSLGTSIDVKFEGTYNDKDRQKIAYIKLRYPRTFDFSGKSSLEFSMPATTGYVFLDISNFDITGGTPVLYDLTNQIRIEGTIVNEKVQIALPPSMVERQLILVNSFSGIQTVSSLKPISFINYKTLDANFIIISNSSLSNDPQSGTNWVEEYSNYRNSPAGRSFNSVVVDVNQLYDQFGYGINRHQISIRNFGHFLKKEWTDPEYLFIIGKGRPYDQIRTESNLNEAITNKTFHVPTFGAKTGGDNLFLATNDTDYPIYSIGRLAAKDGNDVRIYLDKVMSQEANQIGSQTIESKAWRKRILHLGGGNSNNGEQARFKGYLNGFENIIENNQFGGDVTSFYKVSSDPIQISLSDQIKGIIDEGISLMTTFGHASATGFDFTIDDPSSYDNEGRFPVLMSLGCYSGQIHSSGIGISEDFILEEKKGAIVFFASTGVSFENALKSYGNEFYSQIGGDSYGLGIGDVSRNALKNVTNQIGYLAGLMTLHGDPSILVKVGDGPDYVVDASSVQFNPNPISIQLDSFELKFDIVNLGSRVGKKMQIEITQELPDGTQHNIVIDSIEAPKFQTEYNYNIPTLGEEALGINKFFIEIDKGNVIPELPNPQAEENNKLVNSSGGEGLTIHFISNDVNPIFPREFGIVNDQTLTLIATTSNPFLEDQKYIFQIDTTELFDSPFMESNEISQSGGVLKWTPDIMYQNDIVYYWRVSPEENPDIGGFVWKGSSFLYLDGSSRGWNQSHYYQMKKNRYSNIELLEDRNFQFIQDFKDFRVINPVIELPDPKRGKIFINSDRWSFYWGTPDAGVGFLVMDSIDIDPWINSPNNPYGSLYIGNNTSALFAFRTNTVDERETLINFLNNDVPTGNYVLLWTLQEKGFSYDPEEWGGDTTLLGTSLFDILENEGALDVRNLETTGARPYIFVYKKGAGAIEELMAVNEDETLDLSFGIAGNWDEGSIESTPIGPASNWQSLKWKSSTIDNIDTDNYSITVVGIDQNGNDSILINNVIAFDTTLNQIDAEEFPYLKLRFNSQDTLQKSTAQLDYWRVLYEGLPEIALNPSGYFTLNNDTLSQGENFRVGIGIENISPYPMDSVLVKFSITDQANNQTDYFKRFKPLLSGDSLVANFNTLTSDLSNLNTFQISVNPEYDHPEQTLTNNVGFFDFFVETDERNPILDVTFDGVHIMDGDIVSSRPGILMTLKDENQFFSLDDPDLIKVFLKSPYESEARQILVDGDTLTFTPGNAVTENKSQILFQPHLLVDGKYTLIVQAEDRSGNQSGEFDYKISFEVFNKSAITNILNYPNPFSTSTRFVFTITGSELPEDMKIQILTVSGRIVREIRQEELGPLHIGNNITSYAWDGTDEYGAKLANGVYLFRVVSRKANNESFEHINNRSDQFFKNGFGKMVIIR